MHILIFRCLLRFRHLNLNETNMTYIHAILLKNFHLSLFVIIILVFLSLYPQSLRVFFKSPHISQFFHGFNLLTVIHLHYLIEIYFSLSIFVIFWFLKKFVFINTTRIVEYLNTLVNLYQYLIHIVLHNTNLSCWQYISKDLTH